MENLKSKNRWICHKGKVPKMPILTDQANCSGDYYETAGTTYEKAAEAKDKWGYDGLGILLGQGLIGVDLDHCIKDSKLSDFAMEVIKQLDSYTEISPSGKGVHILLYGNPGIDNIRTKGIEIYTAKRYFTFTGKTYAGKTEIRSGRDAEISKLYQRVKAAAGQATSSGAGADQGEIVEGGRHNFLIKRLMQYCYDNAHNKTITEDQIGEYISGVNDEYCKPPIEDIERTILSQVPKYRQLGKEAADKERARISALTAFEGEFSADAVIKRFEERNRKPKPELLPISSALPAFDAFTHTERERISTGIRQLDIILNGGLYNELYILGAETSQGKSAFAMYVAQNIAAAGHDVLYFSLEMSKRELIARGISCYSDKIGRGRVTASDILAYRYEELIEDFVRVSPEHYKEAQELYFKECGEHLYIAENTSTLMSALDIAEKVKDFKESKGHYPVVFVDYLQMLRAGKQDGSDRKTKVDNAVGILKTLSNKTPVFTLASVNRASYGERVEAKSFKESGDIEYTGGLLIGYNCEPSPSEKAMLEEDCTKWKTYTDDRGKQHKERYVDKAEYAAQLAAYSCKAERRIVLSLLKYRNGIKRAEAALTYRAAYNNFVEYKPQWFERSEEEDAED